MYKILSKKQLSPNVCEFVFDVKGVAKHAQPGQFIILRVDSEGERIPFTICDIDKEKGQITLLIQAIGASTQKLCAMKEGDCVADFVGPLGKPTDLKDFFNILVVAGGIGVAVVYPQAKLLKGQGKAVTSVLGARNKDILTYVDKMQNASDRLLIATDDGSAGEKGFVTDIVRKLLEDKTNKFDICFAVGPLPMMRAIANLTKEFGLHTVVSLNPIMIDGTGMCGGCRVTVDGKVKYACVDGPEFDGHLVNFEELMNRNNYYKAQEATHICRLKDGKF